jgi:hypothetical protein
MRDSQGVMWVSCEIMTTNLFLTRAWWEHTSMSSSINSHTFEGGGHSKLCSSYSKFFGGTIWKHDIIEAQNEVL